MAPLGVFDSGVGGLTVVRALRRLLPAESLIYLGDTARVPYGNKSPQTICRFAREDAQFLLAKGVKALVVACNTASAHALESLRRECPVPVIGVIEPGVEATLAHEQSRHVGIIGTTGTIRSGAYQQALKAARPGLKIQAVATPLLVPFVEEDWLRHPALELVLGQYLEPLLLRGMDTLLLGCTHYPMLVPLLRRMLGGKVRLVDSASTCAAHTRDLLKAKGLLRAGRARGGLQIHLTDRSEQAEALARRLLKGEALRIEAAQL